MNKKPTPSFREELLKALNEPKDLPQDTPRLALSVEEAARALAVGRTTVYALIREGQLHAIRICHRTVISITEINAFLDRCSK